MMHWHHQWTTWFANQMRVKHPENPSSWLLRLFWIHNPRTPWKDFQPEQVPNLALWLAKSLQIQPSAPVWMWFLRLWFIPSPNTAYTRQAQRFFSYLFQAIKYLLTRLIQILWLILSWPINQAMYWLSLFGKKIDHQRIGVQVDAVTQQSIQLHRSVPWLIFSAGLLILWEIMTTPLSAINQGIFMLIVWAISIILLHINGRFASLALASLSLISMCRYAWWRINNTLDFDTFLEAFLGYGLLAAEAYTWLVVVLGFIQSAWPLKRKPLPLPEDQSLWPSVDVYIPTYNEPLSVVQPTVLAAMGLDWPKDKINVYILDDGKRESFQALAKELGVGYITRTNNNHAKAGNLNHAMTVTNGSLIAIFDCDHIPVKSFLKETCGWLYRDTRCALVQTPHHFFSPDPFERNLRSFKKVPNEGALFYGLVQDGNDLWNATFFCGSCAVIRRTALDEIGGIAVETVTEDAHTALKLHRLGWRTAYINKTLAAGLATESLSAHIGQRIRWARGMTQIFRLDNPFLGKGLSIFQRICYGNAMLHFLFGIPRLIFLTAPLAFLLFDLSVISTLSTVLLLYVIPYILQSNIANGRIQGKYRHTLWAEVYETVLAWYITIPTTIALFAPKLGKFNVTVKGGMIDKPYFDWRISVPYGILVGLNVIGFSYGCWKLFFTQSNEDFAIIINLIWCLYSIIILGAAIAVASETRQVRHTHRVTDDLPASLYLSDGRVFHARCYDFSMTGLGLQLTGLEHLPRETEISVSLYSNQIEHAFPARVMHHSATGMIGLELLEMDTQQKLAYVQCTFARMDAWDHWNEVQAPNTVKDTIVRILKISWLNYQSILNVLGDQLRKFLPIKPVEPQQLDTK